MGKKILPHMLESFSSYPSAEHETQDPLPGTLAVPVPHFVQLVFGPMSSPNVPAGHSLHWLVVMSI